MGGELTLEHHESEDRDREQAVNRMYQFLLL
jgi:hypothetical protein